MTKVYLVADLYPSGFAIHAICSTQAKARALCIPGYDVYEVRLNVAGPMINEIKEDSATNVNNEQD